MQDPLDADPMIFGPLDLDDVQPWLSDVKPVDPYANVDPYDVFNQGLYDLDMNHWFTDPEITVESLFPSSISPCDLDVHHPSSPPHPPRSRLLSANPTPTWATQLWDGVTLPPSPGPPRPPVRQFTDSTLRPTRRSSVHVLTSSSAPPFSQNRPPITRSFTRSSHDRDATIRRKQRCEDPDMPLKPVLKPPKLAPSAWQLYFTDWIQRQQASGTKLNVAQAAKEAGQEYASLSPQDKEPYKRRSQAAKEARERELNAYMRSLTPDDIKRENAYRAAQRKAGKSRKSNIKDPNAPKKPLSAYFMFLQYIRANPGLVHNIFGNETETTKQSVLAAAKWRSMTDAERQPFLAQAEHEKMEYEAARRLYEDGAPAYGTNINFSILPNSPAFAPVKMESSESDSEGFSTDDGDRLPQS